MNFHLLHERLRRLGFSQALGGHGRCEAAGFSFSKLSGQRPFPRFTVTSSVFLNEPR